MLDSRRLTALAEALADGSPVDWASEESSATAEADRELIAKLRAVASIGELFATLSSGPPVEPGKRGVLAPGTTWGTLRVLEHVGRGRFGDVYRAWDPALDREVALKILVDTDRAQTTDSQVVEEGRLMARVRHEHVIAIHGAQRIDGTTGLWMEFIQGRTLAAELADSGPFGAVALAQAGIELSRALAAVHSAGLVHRDVKAQNVMRDRRGRLVLGDFGAGRELDRSDGIPGGMTGTPAYIAPEIFARQPATEQSDLYSLGALLFHLATGQYPVHGRTLRELGDAHAQGTRASLKSLRPDLPAALIEPIETALDVDPSRRFPDAVAMARALERSVAAPALFRRRALVAAVAIATVSIAGVGWWMNTIRSSPVALATPDWVLVTSAENRTGEPVLDGTIRFALERELAGSTFVKVIPRERLGDTLQLMQKPLDTPLDLSTSREVALRDGAIRVLIAGEVERIGGMYSVSARVVRPTDGAVLATVSEPPVNQQDLLRAIGDLALNVRERLGETLVSLPATSPMTLQRVTTSSLRALQLYSQVVAMQGPEGLFGGKAAAAEQLLKEAIKEDVNFASAYRLLSIAVRLDGEFSGRPRSSEALRYAEHAVSLAKFANHRERIRNEGQVHFVRYTMNRMAPDAHVHAARSIAACEATLQLDPRDVDALIGCTNLYSLTGRPNAEIAARLAEVRPTSFRWQVAAAAALLGATPPRVEEARRYSDRAQRLRPNQPAGWGEFAAVRLFDGNQAWLSNDASSAASTVDRLAEDIPSLSVAARLPYLGQLARAYITLGQLKRAEAMLTPVGRPAQEYFLPLVFMAAENRQALRGMLAGRKIEDMTGTTSLLVDAGMLSEARRAIELLKRRPTMQDDYVAMAEGQLAVAERRFEDAIVAGQEQLRLTPTGASVMRVWRGSVALATALAAKGAVQRAITVLETAPPRSGQGLGGLDWGFEWLPVRERLAQLYRRVGRVAEADTVERELRQLLAVADDEHPIKRRLVQRQSLAR